MRYLLSLITLLGLIGLPSVCFAAIGFDTNSNAIVNTGNITQSYTATGSNLYLVVAELIQSSNTCSPPTWNGVTMTQLTSLVDSGVQAGETLYLFGLGSASSGTHNVVTNCTGSATNLIIISSYTGAQSASAVEATNTNTGSGTSGSVAVTTITNNDWLVGFGRVATGANITSGGSNTTARNTGGGTAIIDTNAAQTPPGSFSLNYNINTTINWATLGFALKPFVVANTNNTWFNDF